MVAAVATKTTSPAKTSAYATALLYLDQISLENRSAISFPVSEDT